MELQLLDFVHISRAFSEVNFVIVASYHVPANHFFWLADDFKGIFVE